MPVMPAASRSDLTLDPSRIVAYTDGVFVVAATLLVLAIDVPDVPDGQLTAALETSSSALFSFFLTFAVIGTFWVRHHGLFGRIARWDGGFVALNLLFLAFIAVLPLPTELLGRYSDEPIAVTIYAVNIILLTGLLTLLHRYAEARGLTREDTTGEGAHRSRQARAAAMVIAGTFAASIPIAYLVDAQVALWTWAAVPLGSRLLSRVRGN